MINAFVRRTLRPRSPTPAVSAVMAFSRHSCDASSMSSYFNVVSAFTFRAIFLLIPRFSSTASIHSCPSVVLSPIRLTSTKNDSGVWVTRHR